ncbi:hypothetical protein BC830DRAFT_1171611 [Chytriomyces sp. MP71]|nr:hypothetical protein BC830DRAFT_1171611 [Chytriomyces sp. MP71]
MDHLPTPVVAQIARHCVLSSAIHLACCSRRLLSMLRGAFEPGTDAAASQDGVKLRETVAKQRGCIGGSLSESSQSLDDAVIAKVGLGCIVCREHLFDTGSLRKVIPSLSREEQVVRKIYTAVAFATSALDCPCCTGLPLPIFSSTQSTATLTSLPRSKLCTPWKCPAPKSPACLSFAFCSQLCGSPTSSLLTCETEDECAQTDAHGCIFCFNVNGNAMEGDKGVWECMAGLDGDDGDEDEDLVDDDEDAVEGESDSFLAGLGLLVGASSTSVTPASLAGGLHERSGKRRKVESEDALGVELVFASVTADLDMTEAQRRRKEMADQARWWSAAAKRCRERGSVRDECICGECDVFNSDVVDDATTDEARGEGDENDA